MKPSWLTSIGTQNKLCLIIILRDYAIKYMCIWPLAWRNKHKPHNSLTPLQWILFFLFTSQREREQWRMKGFTMAHWINLNRKNTSVLAWCQYSVLWETTGPILLPLVGLTAGRPANKIQVGFKIFKIPYR